LGKAAWVEVYRARDTKLKREVAIKVLPDEFSRDAERISRFQRFFRRISEWPAA
jgi:serine/threonine protein kinase